MGEAEVDTPGARPGSPSVFDLHLKSHGAPLQGLKLGSSMTRFVF